MNKPWWAMQGHEIAVLTRHLHMTSKLYAHNLREGWTYAYVEWRGDTAYMFKLFRNGEDITPPSPPTYTLT